VSDEEYPIFRLGPPWWRRTVLVVALPLIAVTFPVAMLAIALARATRDWAAEMRGFPRALLGVTLQAWRGAKDRKDG